MLTNPDGQLPKQVSPCVATGSGASPSPAGADAGTDLGRQLLQDQHFSCTQGCQPF